MMEREGVGFCPTIAAGDAISRYNGWNKGTDPEPERIQNKRKSVKMALEAGVKIVFGGDVGVFSHGENYRELELMVEYGMSAKATLVSATSSNAETFHLDNLGQVKRDFLADLIAVEGNPLEDIKKMRKVTMVMKEGKIYKKPN